LTKQKESIKIRYKQRKEDKAMNDKLLRQAMKDVNEANRKDLSKFISSLILIKLFALITIFSIITAMSMTSQATNHTLRDLGINPTEVTK